MTEDYYEAEWQIRTLEDAYQDREPTEYVVDKFFSTHSLNALYGPPGAMKSMLLADMCAHVVAGSDWLPGVGKDGAGIPVQQSPVFWIDLDNGTRRTDERFSAIGKEMGLPVDSPFYYISMPNPPLDVTDFDALLLFKQVILDCRAKLVVVDNLGLITGMVEENSAGMAIIMGNLRQLAESTGAAIILVHHQRKGGAGGSRAGDALRGHSSIEASLDLALHLMREPNSSEVMIRSTKTRGVDVPTVTARFNFEHIPGTNDLAKAWFDGRAVVRGENPVKEVILEVLSEHDAITKMRLTDEVHERLLREEGINKIRNWITDMIEVTKEIEVQPGKGRAQILKITDGNVPF